MNSREEESDHLSKLQEQNGEKYEDAAEEVEDSWKRKSKQTRESIQRKQKKRKVTKTEKNGNDKKDWNDNETMDFIDMYEENPCLWDVFHNDYSKHDVKAITYSSSPAAFETNVSSIKTKIMDCLLS